MRGFLLKLWSHFRSKNGQGLVEYALILFLVAVVVLTALTSLGRHPANMMNQMSQTLGNV